MAERVASNTLIIIFASIIVIFSIIVFIRGVEANLMFWILRPSDTTALDIVSKFNALSGVSGRVIIDYTNITNNVNYYITSENKIVCVIAKVEEEGSMPLKTVNCYSTTKPASLGDVDDEQEFRLCLLKYYSTRLEIETWWCPYEEKCGNSVGDCEVVG